MTDSEFGVMAYREGHTARIRQAILASAERGDKAGEAEQALVQYLRNASSKTEQAWLKRYDAAIARRT